MNRNREVDIVQRRSPPTGTVVFLFTDIEGSTVRWEAHPSAMQSAVARHDALLSRILEAHGAYIFKTVGDAFCCAFARASDALAAALAVQREMSNEDWRDVDGLSVRVAIHEGDAQVRGGDYFGPNVNRVARLLATGYGGQILVSAGVAETIGDALPPDATLTDLGWHRLKDLTESEHVYQLTAPDLPAGFKPLNSLDAFAHNLPHQTTSFVGRHEDLERIRGLIDSSPLVTIAGTGGVGKTRLALQAAAEVLDARRSAWFVNLAPVTDPHLVAGTILSALDVPQQSSAQPLETLLGYLKNRNALIVLDNCEHLLAEVARVANAIVEHCHNVTLLATSREPLNIACERVYRLPTLDLQSAVELFLDRARSADSRFELRDGDRAIVEDICTRVDCIALAVELAAPRVRVLSLRALADRLHERFRILTGGSRAALPRQQTMHALIDWSYDLLHDDEKLLFRRLSIFRGGFDIEAAGAVCGAKEWDDWRTFELLTALVEKSLVNAEFAADSPRYQILSSIQEYAHERLVHDEDAKRFDFSKSIREYATEKLREADEATALALLHADFFAERATAAYDEWDRDPRPDWLHVFASDLDNFRAALTWSLVEGNAPATGAVLAANVMPVFLRLSLLREATAWSEKALADARGVDDALGARLNYGLSMLYNNQAMLKRALPAAQAAVDAYRKTSDERGLTRALSQVAQQLARQDRASEAMPYAEEAVRLARATGEMRLLASTLQRSAMVYEGDVDRARAWFSECVTLFRTLGRDRELSRALAWWADVEAGAGCTERAIDLSLQALANDPGDAEPYLRVNVARFWALSGDFEAAAVAAREGLKLATDVAHPVLEPAAMSYLAVARAHADTRKAVELIGYAKARFDALESVIEPDSLRLYDGLIESATTTLGEADVRALLSQGASLPDEAARALAGQL